jgi:sec-independent protein translocase protein TatA
LARRPRDPLALRAAHADQERQATLRSFFMPNIGPMELVIVLVIALLVLGPKRLPDAGRAVGKGMRDFKDALSGSSKDDEDYEPGSIERDSSSATT